jgi:hypothetical protein
MGLTRKFRGIASVGLLAVVLTAVLNNVPERPKVVEGALTLTGVKFNGPPTNKWSDGQPYEVDADFSGATGGVAVESILDAYVVYNDEQTISNVRTRTANRWELVKAVTDLNAKKIKLTFMAKCPYSALHTSKSYHPTGPKASPQKDGGHGGKLPIVVNIVNEGAVVTLVNQTSVDMPSEQ